MFPKKNLKNEIKVSLINDRLKSPFNLTYLTLQKDDIHMLVENDAFFKKFFFKKAWNLLKEEKRHFNTQISSFVYNKMFTSEENILNFLKKLTKKKQQNIFDIKINNLNFLSFKAYKNLKRTEFEIMVKLNHILSYNIISLYKLINKINKEESTK